MSGYLTETENHFDQNSNDTLGSAYYNTDDHTDGGVSIMPPEKPYSVPENEFGQQPVKDGNYLDPNTKEQHEKQEGSWTTPREKEKIKSKEGAKKKLLEVRKHILFLVEMAKETPDLIKKPESLEDLVSMGSECVEVYKIIAEGESDGTELNPADAELLNALSAEVEYSYGGVFNVLAAQGKKAARNVGSIPDLKGLDGATKELIRQNFGEKNQSELDKIMNTLQGTNEYNALISLLKSTSSRIISEIGKLFWAEGLERLGKELKSIIEDFKSKSEFVISFISGLLEMLGSVPNEPVNGMRKTFELIDTIVNNPFSAALVPLWRTYKPAIDFCMDGIDQIRKQREEQFRQIGITRGLSKYVANGDKSKISTGMTLGLPGSGEKAKRELLFFMMDVHMVSTKEIFDLKAPESVKSFFMDNIDLVNAGDGRDLLDVDYNNPLNPWDNEVDQLETSVWAHRSNIWVMLYGDMLKPPGRN